MTDNLNAERMRSPGMHLAGGTMCVFGLLLGAAGVMGWLGSSTAGWMAGVTTGILHVAAGAAAWTGRAPAGYAGGAMVFLTCIFFAYRFLATEQLFPSGALLMVGFLALFLVLLGFFLGLAEASGHLRR